MIAEPLTALAGFDGRRVLVVGDAILDSYLNGSAERICREAPVPIVALQHRVDQPGGAANVAVNVARLGGQAVLLSLVGDDPEAALLGEALAVRGVGVEDLHARATRRTLVKHRIVANGQLLARFDQGSTEDADDESDGVLIDRLVALYHTVDAVIVSDYGYGTVTPRVVSALARLQSRFPRLLVADAKDLTRFHGVGVTAAKPNYGEAARILAEREVTSQHHRVEQIGAGAERLLAAIDARVVAVTLDTGGALVLERGAPPYRTYATDSPHSRATGAGDTFVAALALALASDAGTHAAAEIASAAASIVVGKEGTADCSLAELRAVFASADKVTTDLGALAERIALERRHGRRIVFTNGCFDILHRGHVGYLNRAKALGDVLVVGVNDDAGVRRLKGPERPINPLDDRLGVLAGLSCIDVLCSFGEDTPAHLLEIVRPDVFVKGGDYTHDSLPEAPLVESLGGTVRILPFLEDRSTSAIIARARAADGEPADEPSRGMPAEVGA
jgi:D-beta-D-heptose 7-phosphate kinase/D-beta-D-heptose 1-phosphate adenosyltransferase